MNPLLAIGLVCAIPSIFVAALLDHKLRQRAPSVRSFVWGFFLSLQAIGMALVIGAVSAYLMVFDEGLDKPLAIGGIVLVFGAAGVGTLKRTRWGWILLSAITLNPVTWLINYFYGSKRWQELRPLNLARSPHQSTMPLIKSNVDNLERLALLHRAGDLTDQEFAEAKRALLDRP